MSVGLTPIVRPRHWLINLWPLLLFLVLLAGAAQLAWLYWPELLFKTVVWQKSMHQQMVQLLQQVKANPHQTGLALMMFSLSYNFV